MWFVPSSSDHVHFIVPIMILVVRVPPNPFITLSDLVKFGRKSSTLWDMHAEHRLSIPMRLLSVSTVKFLWRARPASEECASKGKAKREIAFNLASFPLFLPLLR